MLPENPASLLCQFALEQLPHAPTSRQVKLYRAIATVIGDEQRAGELLALARDLEAQLALRDETERRHRQLLLDISLDHSAPSNGGTN